MRPFKWKLLNATFLVCLLVVLFLLSVIFFQNFQLKIESIKNHALVVANYTWPQPQYIWRSHGYQVNPLHTRRSVLAKYNINNPVCR